VNRAAIELVRADSALAERFAALMPGLIHATGPVSYAYQFGARAEFFDEIVFASWRGRDSLFSHDATTLALVDGELAGIELGFPGREFYPRRAAVGAIVSDLVSRGRASRDEALALSARAEKASYLNAHVPGGTYYVHALSVREPWRGKGVGARLLRDALERAHSAGHRALQLDVLADNPAVAFYRAHGLATLSETRSPDLTRDHGFPSELRMAIALQSKA